ncbi:hypothetical protein L484_017627 [Morus notabilis]|uniref:Uncharacterized protein n=1 Tax=Morus notabilis TaxID=981085 RepID=W9SGG0_9ROSA|nr:hypothetical protein L484_017627 [Morus notabilis]
MPSPVVAWGPHLMICCLWEVVYLAEKFTTFVIRLLNSGLSSPIGFALVCMPNNSNGQLGFSTKAQYNYKVVLIHPAAPPDDDEDSCEFQVICVGFLKEQRMEDGNRLRDRANLKNKEQSEEQKQMSKKWTATCVFCLLQ